MDLVTFIPLLPLASAIILVIFGRVLPHNAIAALGAGSVGLSALCVLLTFIGWREAATTQQLELWTWMSVGDFQATIGFHIDGLTLVMMSVITGVGFLIHLYSTEFMAQDESFARYFAYMNLFVAAMLILVMADNLLLLYLGWEGVGVCSYLLVGFWYRDPDNGAAARKAFVVTRVGDTAMALGLLVLFTELGTLDIQELATQARQTYQAGDSMIVLATLLLLGGAVGKSAQLPLHTWLPDAMAGPTPVSALIHAATMVTAGVYLIARNYELFLLAPMSLDAVAIIGLLTLLLAAFSALNQHDIKRILAYSTISQIGYMFLALGVGAWSAGIFHLVTHAFFKALLFLAAGAVIHCLHHEHNIFRMGGLRTRLPVVFWSFLIGSAALAALPFTAGFYSKDPILLTAFTKPGLGPLLWAGALLGAALTAMYSFRLVFVVFFGEAQQEPDRQPGWKMAVPLGLLCVMSIAGGWLSLPLAEALPAMPEVHPPAAVHWISIAVPVLGVALAYAVFLGGQINFNSLVQSPLGQNLHRFWHSGWRMDALYELLWTRPYCRIARVLRGEPIDLIYTGVVTMCVSMHEALSDTQTGRLRWYATAMVAGLIVLIGVTLGSSPMIMVGMLLSLLLGGVLAWWAESRGAGNGRWVSLASLALALLLLLASIGQIPVEQFSLVPDPASPESWLLHYKLAWIPRFGIHFELAMDGLSLILVALTLLLGLVAVISSWDEITFQAGFFQANILWTLAGVVGVFLAMDLILFFLFWEVMLVPMYLLIAIWGHEDKAVAAMKFFIFTQFSGLLMLFSILVLAALHAQAGNGFSFSYFDLLGTNIPASAATWVMLGFFIAFAVKLPSFPVHTWLPDAHTQAPTAGSVILAGILLKTGAYGLLRFAIPLFPEASADFAPVAMALGAAGVIYGAVLAFAQTDFKRLVAYSSVSHMGFVLLGLYAWNALAIQGAIMQMVAHGLSTAALFMTAGAIQQRLHTRDMSRMGGLWQQMPRMGACTLFFAVASLGLPGLGNFVAEFLVLIGLFAVNPWMAAVAALGLVTAAVYALIMMQKAFQGIPDPKLVLADYGTREMLAMGAMIVGLVWLGLYPQPVLDLAQPVVDSLLARGGP